MLYVLYNTLSISRNWESSYNQNLAGEDNVWVKGSVILSGSFDINTWQQYIHYRIHYIEVWVFKSRLYIYLFNVYASRTNVCIDKSTIISAYCSRIIIVDVLVNSLIYNSFNKLMILLIYIMRKLHYKPFLLCTSVGIKRLMIANM